MIRRLVYTAAVVSVGGLALAAPVLAHIDPDPSVAQAGSTLTVGFTIEHGCEGSPTVQVDLRLPEGVVDATPEPLDGWTATIEPDAATGRDVVSYTGGVLPDHDEGTFEITMTMPPTPDTTIYFPFVQRCEVGEIRWIGIPTETGDELDEPAPAIELTGPVATTVPPATAAPTVPPVTEPETTEPVVAEPVDTVTSPPPNTTEPLLVAPRDDGTTDKGAGTAVFVGVIIAVVVAGGVLAWRARSGRTANADTITPGRTSTPDQTS